MKKLLTVHIMTNIMTMSYSACIHLVKVSITFWPSSELLLAAANALCILYTVVEVWVRVSETTTGYKHTHTQDTHIPCVGSFISPGIDTRYMGPTAFNVSSERHRQSWINEISKWCQVDLNPCPLDRVQCSSC